MNSIHYQIPENEDEELHQDRLHFQLNPKDQ